jgi:hypothetical protein
MNSADDNGTTAVSPGVSNIGVDRNKTAVTAMPINEKEIGGGGYIPTHGRRLYPTGERRKKWEEFD